MKNIRYSLTAALLLSLTHAASAGGGRFTPETQAQKLSRALSNQEVVVGVFEFPDWEGRGPGWYDLKDGTHIQEYRGRLREWYNMRLLKPIKGETDNLVFFKENAGLGRKVNFVALHGSRWILFMNPLLSINGKLRPYSNYYSDRDLEGICTAKPDIVFELYDGASGALCLEWPKEHHPESRQIYSEELVDDLVDICSALSEQGQKAGEQSPLELKTSLGREIAAVQHLPVSEPEETEP